MMRLTVLQVGGVVAENQHLYSRLEAVTGWNVSLVVPRAFRDEAGLVQRASQWPEFHGQLIQSRVLAAPPIGRPGRNIPLHVYIPSLTQTFRKTRPDAIYVEIDPYAVSAFQAAKANLRASRVPIGFSSNQNIEKRYPWPFSAAERFVLRHASYAFPRTEAAASLLRAKGYRGQLEILPYGIDLTKYRPRDTNRPEDGPLTIGYVGRLVPEKGVDTLLEAIASLPAERVTALIVGGGPAEESLRSTAAQLGLDGRVTWTGFVPAHETADIYRRIDVLAVPSKTTSNWKEQFGRVVIEALASGVPVIASDSGQLPHLIDQTDGGWTFPEGDAAALGRVLTRLVEDRGELLRRAEQARSAAEQAFDLDAVVRRMARTIEAAVDR